MAFVSANAVVCEKTLMEKDDVATLIRVVEVFFIPPNLIGRDDSPPVPVTIYLNVRITSEDEDPHTITIDLVRPNGETATMDVSSGMVQKPKYEGLHRTLNATGQIGVFPKQMGQHYFAVKLDDREVARAYFTLIAQETEVALSPN